MAIVGTYLVSRGKKGFFDTYGGSSYNDQNKYDVSFSSDGNTATVSPHTSYSSGRGEGSIFIYMASLFIGFFVINIVLPLFFSYSMIAVFLLNRKEIKRIAKEEIAKK